MREARFKDRNKLRTRVDKVAASLSLRESDADAARLLAEQQELRRAVELYITISETGARPPLATDSTPPTNDAHVRRRQLKKLQMLMSELGAKVAKSTEQWTSVIKQHAARLRKALAAKFDDVQLAAAHATQWPEAGFDDSAHDAWRTRSRKQADTWMSQIADGDLLLKDRFGFSDAHVVALKWLKANIT